jgi:hypothetical protein
VFDAEAREGPAHLGEAAAVGTRVGGGRMAGPAGAVGVEARGTPWASRTVRRAVMIAGTLSPPSTRWA